MDGLPTFLHFIRTEIAPAKTNKSTKADKTIIAMILMFIFWFLLTKLAEIGRSPALPVGPLPKILPYGGEAGIPDKMFFKS